FTPLVIGETHMGNFESHGMVSWGFACFVVAALLLYLGARIGRRAAATTRVPGGRQTAVAAMVTALIVLPAAPGTAQSASPLQVRIDAAPRGSTLTIESGVHQGPV